MMNGNSESGPGGAEQIKTDILTLTRFLNEEQAKHKEATGDFTYCYPFLIIRRLFSWLTVS